MPEDQEPKIAPVIPQPQRRKPGRPKVSHTARVGKIPIDMEKEALKAVKKFLETKLKKVTAIKGVPSAKKEEDVKRNVDGTMMRPDEIMAQDMQTATQKFPEEELTDSERISVERAIRRYVAKMGGFRENLPEDKQARGLRLLKRMGRTEIAWDTSIVVPGFRC